MIQDLPRGMGNTWKLLSSTGKKIYFHKKRNEMDEMRPIRR